MLKLPVYLDYQATTPCDPRVVSAMLPFFTETFGNPHSRHHAFGWAAEDAVEQAREQVAAIIGAEAREMVFTSGATESSNLALLGVARLYKAKKNHVVSVVTEHKCVLDSCRQLEDEGFAVTLLKVKPSGLIDLDELAAAIGPQTVLVSVMAVNNEIGVVQPLAEIGALCRSRGVFFHTDAAQAVGKIGLDVNAMNIDLMSISAHKFYGPKGIGALYVRRRPRVRLQPIMLGGGQERGMRSGTLATPLCVGLGEACRIAAEEMPAEAARLKELQTRLRQGLLGRLGHVQVNGDLEQRIPGNLNVSFAYVEGERLLAELKNIAVAAGSACSSASVEPSYVLRALGVDAELAFASLRIGLGRTTSVAEVDYAIEHIVEAVTRLREHSPLWGMFREGIDTRAKNWAGH